MPRPTSQLPIRVETRIRVVHGERVMLDADLADVYGVTTKALNQAVKRNRARFPLDFAFRLSRIDASALRSQIVTSNGGRGGRRSPPWVFTEHGAIMAASVLNSRRAVEMSVFVVRAFTRLRAESQRHSAIAAKLDSLERTVGRHDKELKTVIRALRVLLMPKVPSKARIGFRVDPAAEATAAPTKPSASRRRP